MYKISHGFPINTIGGGKAFYEVRKLNTQDLLYEEELQF